MRKSDELLKKLDNAPLYFLLLPLLILFFSYYLLLGENAVFEIHDQLDESVVHNIINAIHLFEGLKVYPEMFSEGVPATGIMPSAITYVLYRFFPVFTAFMLEFLISEICAFLGAYACIKLFSKSSILAVLGGMALMWLPYKPSYGLSIVGFPVIVYAFARLYNAKRQWLSYILIVFYALMTHLAWVGYAVCIFVFFADIILLIISARERKPFKYKHFFIGSAFLVLTYVCVYRELFLQFFTGSGFVSHRDEILILAYPFGYALNVFKYGDESVHPYHIYQIIPIIFLLIIYGIRFRKLEENTKRAYLVALFFFAVNILIAIIYGLCGNNSFIEFRRARTGFFRDFQFNRFYWLYPGTWYICAGAAFSLPVSYHGRMSAKDEKYSVIGHLPLVLVWGIIGISLLPTAWYIRQNSSWLTNKSQYKNNMSVGFISFKDFYAQDLMKEIDEYIGRDKSTYRVASLGLYPAVSQVAGFYTIDGYSNNYPLEYKYKFRNIIAKELDKDPYIQNYYDLWGSRVYLYTAEAPENYGAKTEDFVYRNLDLDTAVMKEMGCEYIFSAGEIEDCGRLSLKLLNIFETDESYYRIYLYEIE